VNGGDVLDWLARGSAIVGLPAVLMYLIKERRKTNAEARRAETDAEYAEAELPNRLRSSSVITIEAELAALQRTFQDDRNAKERTIEWLSEQLEAERAASAAKDARIRDLEAKVTQLQTRVAQLSDELAQVSEDLKSLHDGEPGRDL
jgi:chromosome segregation ATPase